MKKAQPPATQMPAARGGRSKSPAKKQPAAKKADEDDLMQIDSVKEVRGSKKEIKIYRKTRSFLLEIGKKRNKRQMQLDNEEESDDSQEILNAAAKQRKVGSGKDERIERIKAQRPKPVKKLTTVYKRGIWNPDMTDLITFDEERESTSKDI